MKHPHAEIIKALADDDSLTLWGKSCDSKWAEVLLPPGINKVQFVAGWMHYKFHLGPTPPPEMIHTECGSYPMPLRGAPPVGTRVFWARLVDGQGVGTAWHGDGSVTDDWIMECLRSGIVHLTKEGAEQQAKVELALRMKRHEGKV